jgi:hypothetical protein
MKVPHPLSNPSLREFWHGLTTPDLRVVKMAAAIILVVLGVLSAMAINFRHRIEAGKVDWRLMRNDFGRASVLAMTGATRQTDPSAKNLVFVGPSSLRCWLPHPDEASELASLAAGGKVRVLSMCSGRQSYAVTAALVDRFGANFDGWFVIGVGRQLIGRKLTDEDVKARQQQSLVLGFYSDVLTQASGVLGFPQNPTTGWELWDHRDFHHRHELGLKLLPFRKRKIYQPYVERANVPVETWGSAINALDADSLQRHLMVLEQLARDVRNHGRARVALVETPWVDAYTPTLQTPEWKRDEEAYQQTMREWARKNNVPWIDHPASFAASTAYFVDPKHVGIPALRRQFLDAVVHALTTY